MKMRFELGRRAIKVKPRPYSAHQRSRLDKYIAKLRELQFIVDMPMAE